jgi:hypothetical protein
MGQKTEWMQIVVWEKVQLRLRVELEKGSMTDMMVQLEINDGGWRPAIRYNYAHGKPHLDKMFKDGRKEKIWMEHKTLKEAMTLGYENVKSNWRKLLWECGYHEID